MKTSVAWESRPCIFKGMAETAMLRVALFIVFTSVASAKPATTQSTSIEFLDAAAGKAAIVDDSAEPYFEKLSDQEMTVKSGSEITGETREQKIAEMKRRAQAAVREFSEDEQKLVRGIIEQQMPVLREKYSLFAAQPWSFIKVAGTYEGGMPHTRGSHVILSEPALQMFEMMSRQEQARSEAATVLVHEQTHVMQRAHPDLFPAAFTEVLGFKRAKKIESHPWLDERQLVNPDGSVCDWVFPLKEGDATRWIWPLIAFQNPDAKNFGEVNFIAVELEPLANDDFRVKVGADGNPVVEPLENVTGYREAVGTDRNAYHPNEITADLFAQIVVHPDVEGTPTLVKFRKWAEGSMAK